MTRIRAATANERAGVRNVIDGAALALEPEALGSALTRGDVLVAESDAGGVVLGALVLEGEQIRAIAVRRSRRGQGLGTALLEAASAQRERLVAAFDPDLTPFWTSVGFAVVDRREDRCLAVR